MKVARTSLKMILGSCSLLTLAACSQPGSGQASLESGVDKADTAAKTAQGIMVRFDPIDDIAIVINQIYSLNKTTAATSYVHALDSSIAVKITCSGSPTDCSTTNRPASPAAPAPKTSELESLVWSSRCIFLDGGSLPGATYKQSVSLKGKNNKGNFTFEYSYKIEALASVAPMTAWDLVQETGGDGAISVAVGAEIAGQSVVQNSNPKIGTKYSFSLLDGEGFSRVKDLQLSLNDQLVAYPEHEVKVNCPGCKAGDNGAVDFLFSSNAGTNGSLALLSDGSAPGDASLAKQARDILNGDTFAGNNDGGSDGKSLAKAIMAKVQLPLALGENVVKLTGTVKGVDLIAQASFSVSKKVHVVAQGCSNPDL